jgi:hypothetical protein
MKKTMFLIPLALAVILSVSLAKYDVFAQYDVSLEDYKITPQSNATDTLKGILTIEQAEAYLSAAKESLQFKDTSTAELYFDNALKLLNDLKEKVEAQ